MVELTSAMVENVLYEVYRTLRAIGVQIVHATVRRRGDQLVQRFALIETDGRALTDRRLRESLSAIRASFGLTTVHGTLPDPGYLPLEAALGA